MVSVPLVLVALLRGYGLSAAVRLRCIQVLGLGGRLRIIFFLPAPTIPRIG
jgi:hypothetical protein